MIKRILLTMCSALVLYICAPTRASVPNPGWAPFWQKHGLPYPTEWSDLPDAEVLTNLEKVVGAATTDDLGLMISSLSFSLPDAYRHKLIAKTRGEVQAVLLAAALQQRPMVPNPGWFADSILWSDALETYTHDIKNGPVDKLSLYGGILARNGYLGNAPTLLMIYNKTGNGDGHKYFLDTTRSFFGQLGVGAQGELDELVVTKQALTPALARFSDRLATEQKQGRMDATQAARTRAKAKAAIAQFPEQFVLLPPESQMEVNRVRKAGGALPGRGVGVLVGEVEGTVVGESR